MERHIDTELTQVKQDLLRMAGMVELAIDKSIEALKDRNSTLAQEVIRADQQVNAIEIEIENACFTILARQQPFAADLRFLMSCIKINNDLERMADHAVNIAETAEELATTQPIKPLIDIPYMAKIVQGMLRDSLDSFIRLDAEKARQVCENDDVVDGLDRQVQRELITYMMEDHRKITQALGLTLVSKNLERIADLSTNVGEEVIFIVEARTIKHHHEDVHLGGQTGKPSP